MGFGLIYLSLLLFECIVGSRKPDAGSLETSQLSIRPPLKDQTGVIKSQILCFSFLSPFLLLSEP